MQNLFKTALGVNSPWFIKGFDFENKRLNIHIDFKRGSKFYDEDIDNKGYTAYDTSVKKFRHLNFFEHECYLHIRVPRIKRDDDRVRTILPPWAGKLYGFSALFEAYVVQLCKYSPVHNVSNLVNISDYKIWRLLDIYIDAAKYDEDLSHIDTVGLDETSVAKVHDYITLFVDLLKKSIVHISDGKDSQTVGDFVQVLNEHNANRNQIKSVSCDMSKAFIKGVKDNLPNAEITFDKFHIIKIINEGVDRVRREEARSNPVLKGTRYIFLKNINNLSKKQKEKKAELELSNLNLQTFNAMRMRETFQQLYHATNLEVFEELLKKWYAWVSECDLSPMVKVAKTIKSHWQGILQWKLSSINNGILEGLNSIIQAAKRKARGYGKKHFKTIAYLLSGKLNLNKVNPNLPTCF